MRAKVLIASGSLCGLLCSAAAAPPPAPAAAAKGQKAPAAAKAPAGKGAKVAPPDPAEELAPQLSGPEDQVLDAVQKLAALPGQRATDLLLNELSLGVPPRVAAAMLEALAPKKDPRTLDVLTYWSRNRNPDLRKRAVVALGAIQDPRVAPLLVAALSDATADVRGAAAQALGARREKAAEGSLLKLLAQKDTAAPPALGQIGGAETARTLAEMVGNVPDRLIVQTLGEMLKRPDFGPDPLRLEVVKTLGKIPGAEALDALTDYQQLTAKDKARPSRVEAGKIIEQRTAK
jgi:HEAT repeat protein